MNLNRTSSLDGLPGGADDDSEVMSVLDGYLSAIEAGQPPDPDKLLADHPALAGQLRAYLRVMSVAGRLAEDSSAASSSASTAPAPELECALDARSGTWSADPMFICSKFPTNASRS